MLAAGHSTVRAGNSAARNSTLRNSTVRAGNSTARASSKKGDRAGDKPPISNMNKNRTKAQGDGSKGHGYMMSLDAQPKTDRNPLSAQQASCDPVKTYKLGLTKAKDSNHSSKSQLKSPTDCAITATTSANIGSLTRAEGNILVRQSSVNARSRSPASLGSKIGSGAAKLLQNCKNDERTRDEIDELQEPNDETQGDLTEPVKFRQNIKEFARF